MKKRFTRTIETFQVEMTLKMYQIFDDYINYSNDNRTLSGSNIICVLEDNVDYNDPDLFFYCPEDRSFLGVEDIIKFCYEVSSDIEYEFEVDWRKGIVFTEMVRDKKISLLLD